MIEKQQKGFTVIEILIAITLTSIFLSAMLGFAVHSLKNAITIKKSYQANYLALEGIEVLRNIRDGTDWSVNGIGSFDVNTEYYVQKNEDNPPKWILALGNENIDVFIRHLIIERVSRDENDNIELNFNPMNEDVEIRKIISKVSWNEAEKNHQIEIYTYLTNWKN